jgi:hypothetical protein
LINRRTFIGLPPWLTKETIEISLPYGVCDLNLPRFTEQQDEGGFDGVSIRKIDQRLPRKDIPWLLNLWMARMVYGSLQMILAK